MKHLIHFGLACMIVAIPGDSYGFPYHRGPVMMHQMPFMMHTPTFVAPHTFYRPPVASSYRPAFVPRTYAPAVVRHPTAGYSPAFTRPAVGFGYRPSVGSYSALASRNVYVNRATGLYRPGYAYYHDRYAAWHHGYWSGWYNGPGLWYGAGLATGWLYPPGGQLPYWNPYYVSVDQPVYDYSQPVYVPAPVLVRQQPDYASSFLNGLQSPADAAPLAPADNDNAAPAAKMLDDARQAFALKDYDKAQEIVDSAIGKSPKDTTLHEFRALVLFARQRYQEAAATIHSVLAVGPGWDWGTMVTIYRDVNVYTAQLRGLEQFTKANPADAASRFLLAYHYLVLDHRDAAVKILRRVLELQPKDELAAHLLQMLVKKTDSDRPVPGT